MGIFSDHCPAIISDYLETSKYDDTALQDDDGHPYFVGTTLLQDIDRHCVPTDDETSMSVMKKFETLLTGIPGILSASSFGQLEKLGNKTAEQWNRLSPYDDQLRSALPRFLQMLDHQLKSRKMANVDRSVCVCVCMCVCVRVCACVCVCVRVCVHDHMGTQQPKKIPMGPKMQKKCAWAEMYQNDGLPWIYPTNDRHWCCIPPPLLYTDVAFLLCCRS